VLSPAVSLVFLSFLSATPADPPATPAAATVATEDARFRSLRDESWEWLLRQYPTSATALGDKRYDDRWEDVSTENIAKQKEHHRGLLRRVKAIDPARLSAAEATNYALFRRDAEMQVAAAAFPGELLPVTQLGGVHTSLPSLIQSTNLATVRDFENLITRMRKYPALVEQNIALMQKGLALGVTPPKTTLGGVEAQIAALLADDPTDSTIYKLAFAEMPASIPDAVKGRLRDSGRKALQEHVLPALRKFRAFWTNEYYPLARETVGLSALPNGAAWYAFSVREHTTTGLSPNAIHEIGLAEVRRIRAEMEKVRGEAGFEGDLPAFFDFLRTDPRFFFTEPDQLLTAYRDICKRVDPELPRLFGKLPRLPYGVKAVPEHSEKDMPAAYYALGSMAAGQPGYFFANTFDLKSRPKWEMESLTLHEAVPGHHLQSALAQEQADLPMFRRYAGYTAYSEGWGLYAESLGFDLGLYKDPYQRMGRCSNEMLRAVRLVVDTGIHAKGWTKEQAERYFRDNVATPDKEVEVEINRYIVWPGQALAYKIGELKIRELRTRAEKELGDQFDVRAFHDEVLGMGAVPLDVLEQHIQGWIAKNKVNGRRQSPSSNGSLPGR